MRQLLLFKNATALLQFATVITKCVDFITKYDNYYKMHRLLRNTSVQSAKLIFIFLPIIFLCS